MYPTMLEKHLKIYEQLLNLPLNFSLTILLGIYVFNGLFAAPLNPCIIEIAK